MNLVIDGFEIFVTLFHDDETGETIVEDVEMADGSPLAPAIAELADSGALDEIVADAIDDRDERGV